MKNKATMRGCALPLTQFTYLPSHLCNTIIKINSFPFLHSFPSHHSLTIHNPTTPIPFTSLHAHHQPHDDDEQENFHVLTAVKSDYNDIMIVDTPNSRMLLLDSSRSYPSHPLSFSFFVSVFFCFYVLIVY